MGGFSTAVMPPTNRGFDITPPDPYANLKALALQGEAQQRQQEIAASKQTMAVQQQQMELTAQKIRDQQALAQTLREWTPSQSADDFVKKVIDNGGSGDAGLQAQQHFIDLHLKNTQLNESQLKLRQAKHEQLASQVQTILDAKSPEEKLSRWTQYHPAMLGEIDEGETLPDGLPNDEYLQGLRNGHMLSSEISKQDLEKAQAGEAAARGKQAEAEAGKLSVEQELTKHKLDLYKTLTQTPQALEQRVAGSVNPQKYPDLFARTLNEARNQPDIDHINAAIEKGTQAVTEQERTIATETDPRVLQARTQQAVNTETATAPIKTGVAVATQRALNNAPGYENVPPREIPKVQGEVGKVVDAYGSALNASNEMQGVIDLMRGHNKIAYAYSPVNGVLTINTANGVKRVNMAEIKTYGGAGSLADRVEGWFGKNLTGESVPPAIVDAMEQMNGGLAQNARNTAALKIQGVNKVYRSTVNPEDVLVKNGKPAASTGTIYARDPQGKLHQAAAGTPLPSGWKQEQR